MIDPDLADQVRDETQRALVQWLKDNQSDSIRRLPMAPDQVWTTTRTLDPVRAAALTAAAQLFADARNHTVGDVVKAAKEFEQYLASKETP